MNYTDFKNEVRTCLERKLKGTGTQIEIRTVVKTNDDVRDSITLMEEEMLAAPTVYLNDFYEFYKQGVSIEEIADQILIVHEQYRHACPPDFLQFDDFEYAKNNITFRLVNERINEQYLKDVVYKPFLDLAVVFYCTVITGKQRHVLSSKITRELMEHWGTDIDTLYELALVNTEALFGIDLKEVSEFFTERIPEEGDEELRKALADRERSAMFILSNRPHLDGAGVILLDHVLEKLADVIEDDLYIIPSSIHEVMVIPVHARLEREDIDELVQAVNAHLVSIQELLSNHVYIYDRKQKQIVM